MHCCRLLFVAALTGGCLSGCGATVSNHSEPTDAQVAGDAGDDLSATHDDAAPSVDQLIPADTSSPTIDAAVNCQAMEICGDGLDNNCNGEVDEGCACVPGTTERCYRGPADTRNVGVCRDGKALCAGSNEFGMWGPCMGDVLPSPEKCDPDFKDENCNGTSNEGCQCAVGSKPTPCGSSVGACKPGSEMCINGQLGNCMGAVGPTPEICDGIDNDCNGLTDDIAPVACGTNVGACKPGVQACQMGHLICAGGVQPVPELCNNVDDDCNGLTDDGLKRTCGSNVGACKPGMETCAMGLWSTCMGGVQPAPETCNNIDDNCDGMTDEGLTKSCGNNVGICQPGTEQCVGGVYGACMGGVMPQPKDLCDGKDENCDGVINGGCGCMVGATLACGMKGGACVQGVETCSMAGMWGACVGGVGPMPELCDHIDNNCNGMTDEGCACENGDVRACGSNVGACKPGSQTCDLMGNWGACMGGVGPMPEICNHIDDNCNGMTDEGGVCPMLPPTVMCPGAVNTTVGLTIMLTATDADPNGMVASVAWTVAAAPNGSNAAPAAPAMTTTPFSPDQPGVYTLRFCATDVNGLSACCTTQVTAASACMNPPAPAASTTCDTSWDGRPIVQFPAVPNGFVYNIFEVGNVNSLGSATAGQNYFRPAMRIDAGGPPPGNPIQLFVRACTVNDNTCCTNSATVTANVVEDCNMSVVPSSSNLVISEYVTNGEGPCANGNPACQAGEAVEITNILNCPVALSGYHFAYCNNTCAAGSVRFMNFGQADIIPARGVYVAIRDRPDAPTCSASLGAESPALFGLKISQLAMQGQNLQSGWFLNTGGGQSVLRVASGAFVDMVTGNEVARIAPYLPLNGSSPVCAGIGFPAAGSCGDVAPHAVPTMLLNPNQLGRLWHPCDAVLNPNPPNCG